MWKMPTLVASNSIRKVCDSTWHISAYVKKWQVGWSEVHGTGISLTSTIMWKLKVKPSQPLESLETRIFAMWTGVSICFNQLMNLFHQQEQWKLGSLVPTENTVPSCWLNMVEPASWKLVKLDTFAPIGVNMQMLESIGKHHLVLPCVLGCCDLVALQLLKSAHGGERSVELWTTWYCTTRVGTWPWTHQTGITSSKGDMLDILANNLPVTVIFAKMDEET